MPKRKKEMELNDFPALTQLLTEIARYRERERIQPRLPFETPAVDTRQTPKPGRLDDQPKRGRRSRSGYATDLSSTQGKMLPR